MHLAQFLNDKGQRAVAAIEGGLASPVTGAGGVYALAIEAMDRGLRLGALIIEKGLDTPLDLEAIAAEGRLLAPIDHPDPAHLYVTGTGLTHLGSAATRDAMHKSNQRRRWSVFQSRRRR